MAAVKLIVDTETETRIAELVDRGGKLAADIHALERKQEELNTIKAQLREFANGKDQTYIGKLYTVSIEQKNDTICRSVEEIQVPRVVKMAGEALLKLFTLHPSKGCEKNFELNAHKALPKKTASALVKLLTVHATAWARFSKRPVRPGPV